MRMIQAEQITQTIKRLCLTACCELPQDVVAALEAAHQREEGVAKEIFEQLLTNQNMARKAHRPCCQDTGLAVVFADIGQDAHVQGDLYAAVDEGVRQAYTEGFLRKSALSALERKIRRTIRRPLCISALFPATRSI